MNHNDIKICIAHQDVEKRYQYSRAMNFMRGLKAITEPLRKEEFLSIPDPSDFIHLQPGDNFDLGGETIEVC